MTQAAAKTLTFAEFLDRKPEDKLHELYDGIITEMQPTGKHEEITGFLTTELVVEYRKENLPYFIPKTALVKAKDRQSAYCPDVLILNRPALESETLWSKYSTVQEAKSIALIVEVTLKDTASHTSTNWRDDYLTKLRDYEEIGVQEYWIIDYLGLGGKRYIGDPKQPTISIYQLIEGEYQVNQFRDKNRLLSAIFPDLDLTAERVFLASEI